MDKPANIFILCTECRAVNVLAKWMEESLDYTHAIICNECDHKHTDLAALRSYAKQTGVHE